MLTLPLSTDSVTDAPPAGDAIDDRVAQANAQLFGFLVAAPQGGDTGHRGDRHARRHDEPKVGASASEGAGLSLSYSTLSAFFGWALIGRATAHVETASTSDTARPPSASPRNAIGSSFAQAPDTNSGERQIQHWHIRGSLEPKTIDSQGQAGARPCTSMGILLQVEDAPAIDAGAPQHLPPSGQMTIESPLSDRREVQAVPALVMPSELDIQRPTTRALQSARFSATGDEPPSGTGPADVQPAASHEMGAKAAARTPAAQIIQPDAVAPHRVGIDAIENRALSHSSADDSRTPLLAPGAILGSSDDSQSSVERRSVPTPHSGAPWETAASLDVALQARPSEPHANEGGETGQFDRLAVPAKTHEAVAATASSSHPSEIVTSIHTHSRVHMRGSGSSDLQTSTTAYRGDSLPATAQVAFSDSSLTPVPAAVRELDDRIWAQVSSLQVSTTTSGSGKVHVTMDSGALAGTRIEVSLDAGAWRVDIACDVAVAIATVRANAESLARRLSERLRRDVSVSVDTASADEVRAYAIGAAAATASSGGGVRR